MSLGFNCSVSSIRFESLRIQESAMLSELPVLSFLIRNHPSAELLIAVYNLAVPWLATAGSGIGFEKIE